MLTINFLSLPLFISILLFLYIPIISLVLFFRSALYISSFSFLSSCRIALDKTKFMNCSAEHHRDASGYLKNIERASKEEVPINISSIEKL